MLEAFFQGTIGPTRSYMKSSYISKSASDTEAYAEQIGNNLKGGEIIELISDLGGGKTTFVRGLARGMGSTDAVSSPSFTTVSYTHLRQL